MISPDDIKAEPEDATNEENFSNSNALLKGKFIDNNFNLIIN